MDNSYSTACMYIIHLFHFSNLFCSFYVVYIFYNILSLPCILISSYKLCKVG